MSAEAEGGELQTDEVSLPVNDLNRVQIFITEHSDFLRESRFFAAII